MLKLSYIAIILASVLIFPVLLFPQSTPSDLGDSIIERIIQDTKFELIDTYQAAIPDLQIINFHAASRLINSSELIAVSLIKSPAVKEICLGVFHSKPYEVFINDLLVFANNNKSDFNYREIAYDKYSYQDTIKIRLQKGENKILFKTIDAADNRIYLREIISEGEKDKISFSDFIKDDTTGLYPWVYFESSSSVNKSDINKNNRFRLFPKTQKKLKAEPKRIFKKEPYTEWNYANGSLMYSILNYAENTGNTKYSDFVKQNCDFIFSNIGLFRKQYYTDDNLMTSNYRMFRKSMLDDAGAPVLPFIEYSIKHGCHTYDSLIITMGQYVFREQFRLNDGTLCRPEPDINSVWADDIFMAVPLLVRLGKYLNENKYYDDASNQVINFYNYLYDSSMSVYKHCWYGKTNKKSKVFWGRANGWAIWGLTEALKFVPPDHSLYSELVKIYKAHMLGLLTLQDSSGMWHQILDNNKSYLETSSTAMYIIALSRGIQAGWLDEKHSINLKRAWEAMVKNIDNNGIVTNICSGTSVSEDEDYYLTRPCYPNDPRGLGAVITACYEMNNFLLKYK